jgi:hypothetical protein
MFSSSDYIQSNERVISKRRYTEKGAEGSIRVLIWSNILACLEKMRKTTNILSQDSGYPSEISTRDLPNKSHEC